MAVNLSPFKNILLKINTFSGTNKLIDFICKELINYFFEIEVIVFKNNSLICSYNKDSQSKTIKNKELLSTILLKENSTDTTNPTYYRLKNDLEFAVLNLKTEDKDAVDLIINTLNLKLDNIFLREKTAHNSRLHLIENILLNTKDGIQVADITGKMVYINNEVSARLGIPTNEVQKYHVSDFEPLFKDPINWEQHIEVLRKKGIVVIESTNYHVGSNKDIQVELIVSILEFNGNEYIIAASRDIEERIIARNALLASKVQAEEIVSFKDEFIANMSHEIRTPLNGILGLSRELTKHDLPEEVQEIIKHLRASGKFLSSIINNVLDISKINDGNFNLNIQEIDLNQTLNQVKSIIQPQAIEKGLTFTVNPASDINSELYTDETCLKQILINVLHNAVKFTNEGEITLDINNCKDNTDQNKNCLTFTITDTGIGMTEDFIPKLFDKFTQEGTVEKFKNQGTGLGMSITKELVEKLGGRILVKTKKNKGTTFEITIPFQKVNGTKQLEKAVVDTSVLFRKNILIVEDNPINRLVAKSSLRKYQCKITECENGLEAFEFLKNNNYNIDLILMDIQMPIMDGFEASKKIRNELKLLTPIVGLTANSLHFSKENYESFGINECIFKPYDETHFLNTLSSILEENHQKTPFDLSHLKKITFEDKGLFNEIILLFFDAIPETIENLESQLKNNLFQEFKKTIHKVKPNIHTFRITEIMNDIDYLNQIDENEFLQTTTTERILKVISTLQIVRTNLKKHLI
jgi:PAS domain S-box-containing protein